MLPKTLLLLCLTVIAARTQDTSVTIGSDSRSISTLTSNIPTSDFTGSQYVYLTYSGQSTRDTSSRSSNATATSSSSNAQITRSSTSQSQFIIGGSGTSSISNATASSTSSSVAPTNTLPCNNYPEFCNRKYSNITEVCAHNSAFVIKNNAASNQELSVTDQLNDGVRMCEYTRLRLLVWALY